MDVYFGLEALASIGEASEYLQLDPLAVLLLPDDVARLLIDFRLQQDLSDA